MAGNMIGRIFNNRYKIVDQIGIGGMAEVYRAQDDVLGRIVAVKTMLPQYAADASFTQRFRQEAASAANLQSPYIVNVYDWGQDEGTYYIVMEYIRGSDLKTAIQERGSINQRKVAEIGSQVCQALGVAHGLDIIHRDIKPQNIMIQPDGNVKVMDFGIARAKNSVMTQTSSVLGTAHYISPEQAQGKELTATSDIYSLGIVLYEAATGQLPFDGPDAVSVAMQQVNNEPALPSEINPDIDPDLEDIIMKALAKQPQERFHTANDMRTALNDYLAGRPVALDGTFGAAETAILGGMAGAAAGAAMADGTAVMPAVANASQGTGATNYRSGDSGKKNSNKKTIGIVVGVIAAIALIATLVFALGGSGDPVPDVTGKTLEEATQIITDAGFEVGKTESIFSADVEEGKIISQDPSPRSKAEKGTKINLMISSGKEEATVPDLTNMTADQAKEALTKAGLKPEAGAAEYSSDIEVNRVMKQSPAAGEKVSSGDTVIYVLSLGTENIDVPNVVGKSRNDAINTLENAGFKTAEDSSQYSSSVPEGYVISQSPNGGKLEKGKTVTFVISKGQEPPAPDPDPNVPNVVGWRLSEAVSSLQNAGFNVSISGSEDPDAKVVSQSPQSGTAPKGSTVTITTEAPAAAG